MLKSAAAQKPWLVQFFGTIFGMVSGEDTKVSGDANEWRAVQPVITPKGGMDVQINFNSEKPIFVQIAEGISDAILSGVYPEESQIPSITEFSTTFKINPATALKGINILVDSDIVYKRRGLGMFVKAGAVEKLRQNRKDKFYDNFISVLVTEAKRLEITEEEIHAMIERGFDQ